MRARAAAVAGALALAGFALPAAAAPRDREAPSVQRPERAPQRSRPVLLVHGVLDTRHQFDRMRRALLAAGFGPVVAIDLEPNDASVPIHLLSHQVAGAVEVLRGASGQERIDLVGFSMGALASRYYVQRLGGRDRVRRFVSISGPQQGTLIAWLWCGAGVREMRPGSALLRGLARDPDPWGEVEVSVLYTPLDLTILPPGSSRLAGAVETRTFPVLAHFLMLLDREVIGAVVEILSRPPAGMLLAPERPR